MAYKPPPKRKRNELKRRVLGALEDREWVSTPILRRLTGWVAGRVLNFHMERYRSYGLVKRKGNWNAKPVLWRITRQGEKKLAWLRRTM
jgi:hypothetical protein